MIPTTTPFPFPLAIARSWAGGVPFLRTLSILPFLAAAIAVAIATILAPAHATAADVPVQVIVDMDRETPGFQSDVRVPAGDMWSSSATSPSG